MKNKITGCLVALIVVIALVIFSGACYTIQETEQAIITQFGKPVGAPINSPTAETSEAGLHFKMPFLWKVNKFDKRILEWDGQAEGMPTKEKTYIEVDTYGRWRIADPLVYFQNLSDERRAQSRLDDILGSETRNTIAKHELIEAIRSTKDRVPLEPVELVEADLSGSVGKLQPIRFGRSVLEQEIFEKSAAKLSGLGIELLDVRFKRINYNESVQEQIFERMISERRQIADRFRSEGEGEAAKILGNMEKELKQIQSTAYKEVQSIKGEADAKATEIYASAYNQNPDSVAFYEFVRTMDLYAEILGGDSTVILSTDSDLFQYLKRAEPKGGLPLPAVSKPSPSRPPVGTPAPN
ncbi:MAG: protease modulator HflC [Verrucomicrobiae bacterium]|nr:protease modulator HflC [Verrucomicrobiae bacterium]